MSLRTRAKQAIRDEVDLRTKAQIRAEKEARAKALAAKKITEREENQRQICLQLEEEKDRAQLESESESVAAFRRRCGDLFEKDQQAYRELQAWKDYSEGSALPVGNEERQLATFLSHWDAHQESRAEQWLIGCEEAGKVAERLLITSLEAKYNADDGLENFYKRFSLAVLDVFRRKIDTCISQTLFSDQVDEAVAGRMETQREFMSDQCQVLLGVWGHGAANGIRARVIKFPSINITLDLAKTIGLHLMAESVGVLTSYGNLERDVRLLNSEGPFLFIGGILRVELFSLRFKPTPMGDWTMRLISADGQTIRRLPSVVTALPDFNWTEALPSKVDFFLPQDIIVHDALQVAWHDPHEDRWRTDLITDVEIDAETRRVSFQTFNLSGFALLQARTLDFPYRRWHLRALRPGETQLSLLCQRYHLIFQFSSEGVKLISPCDVEALQDILATEHSPAALLAKLMRTGINLLPTENDAVEINIRLKNASIERRACEELALLASFFDMSCCAENASTSEDEVVVKIKENIRCDILDPENADFEPDFEAFTFFKSTCRHGKPSFKDRRIKHLYTASLDAGMTTRRW